MKYILGTKEEMTQVFAESGVVTPATVVRVPANVVTQIRTEDRDGYTAVQLGVGTQKPHRVSKPQKGHLKGKQPFARLQEFRVPADVQAPQEGVQIDIASFEPGDSVHVSGTSKGKGFQGVVKRHGFKGGPRTHGQKHTERSPGSIGATGPQRVFKGTRMAGRMGGERITVKNLEILAVDPENNLLIISGALPGRRGSFIEIYGEGEMKWKQQDDTPAVQQKEEESPEEKNEESAEEQSESTEKEADPQPEKTNTSA